MKTIGTILIIIGLIWGVFSFNIDTSIEVGGESYGSGEYVFKIPKTRVNNFGLMNDKQNNISGAGITLVIGVILFIFGGRKEEEKMQEDKQGFTETVIQDDDNKFKISFQMKNENSWDNIKTKLFAYYKEQDIENIISEKEMSWMLGANEGVKGYIEARLNEDIISIQCFKLPKPDIEIINSETKQKEEQTVQKNNSTDKLIELGKLLEKELITKEEFDKEKKKTLEG
ncbi:MAG: hypothetical protein Q9M37_08455 [Desulfonauticus sp.]|nr:hypothetical protein [Desulfonauticus sp.]